MTKEQFYKNCLTEQGKELIDKEFNKPETMLKGYYKKDIDLKDINNWDEIIYMPKYAKVNTIDGYFDEEEANYEILEEKDWKVYSFLDLLKSNYHLLENKMNKVLEEYAKNNNIKLPTDYNELVEWTIKQYNELNGEDIFVKITNEAVNLETETKEFENLDNTQIIALVEKLLTKIDKQEADIVRMKFLEIKTNEEIAKMYNTTPENVKAIIDYAISKLHEIYKSGEI